MSLKQKLKECIPPAYYSDGTEAKCMWYKIFNMFDLDPQSYIIDKEKKGMEKTNWPQTCTGSAGGDFFKSTCTGSTIDYEISFSDPELQKQYEKKDKKK